MTMTYAAGCDLLVLCGGLGTRLRQAVSDRPKALAAIGDRPFLDFLLEHFVHHGIARIILCTGYLGDYIDRHYADTRHVYELVIAREPSPMGTAGAVKQVERLIRSDPFMVVNGDSLIDVDPNELLEFHAVKQGWATIALASADARHDVGFVTLGPHGQVTAFLEKRSGQASPYHNAGLYVISKAVLAEIPERRPLSIESDVLPGLLPRGVFGFVSDAPLYDIGTPERLGAFARDRHNWPGSVLSGTMRGISRKRSS